MENNTVQDQTELSEVTRPILNQEDGASSNFPNIDNDTINNTERQYKAEHEEKVSDQITTNITIDTQAAEVGLVSTNPEETEVLKEDDPEKVSDEIIAKMTIATQSAESAMIRRNSEGNDIPNENITEKVSDRITANMAIETQNADIGSRTSNFEKIEIPREDMKFRKHVEDAPLTFVDHDDGLMKWLGKACGVGKEKLLNEDLEPYTKVPSGKSKEMGHTASAEGGFDEVKLNFEKRVGERLAYRCDENVVITETVNERGNLDYKRAHSDLRSKEMNVNGDVRGYVSYDTATQEEKQRLNKKNQEPRHENKLPNPNQTKFRSRHHKGQKSHDSTHRGYDDIYNFNHPQRGYMLTIVNDKFSRQSPRDGAQWDLVKMKEIGRKFGFRSLNHNQEMNLTKEQILHWLSIARRTNHSECDCFMFMISTHGLEQRNALKGGQVDHALVCADDQLIFTSTILDMFNDENCPTLKGKPKIFYIQACRGEQLDHGGDVFVAYPKNEDKTCGVSNEEESGRKGRESLDESDTNFGEDSWVYNQQYGARGFTGGQAPSSAPYHTTPTHQHNVSHNPTPSASSQVPVSGRTNPSSQFSQAAHQRTSAHQSSSRTYNAQEPNYQQPSFMVPKVSQPTRSKVLHAPGHLVSRIYAPSPYAIVDTPSLKCDNDMLIMYAIPPGMFAWRNTSEGSWMIDYLYKVMMAYDMKRPKNFLNLMTKVSSLMSQRTTNTPSAPAMHEKKAVSVIEYKLVKDIFFKQKGPGSDWVKKSKTFAL